MHRISLALRGPGVLLLLLGISLGGKAVAQRGSTRALPSPPPIPFFLRVSDAGRSVDHATGLAAGVSDARIGRLVAGQKPAEPKELTIMLRITFRNTAHDPQPVDPNNFYGLADSGQTYGTDRRVRGLPSLRRATVPPHGGLTAWIEFSLAAIPERITLIWNDGNRLLPPASVASVSIVRTATK